MFFFQLHHPPYRDSLGFGGSGCSPWSSPQFTDTSVRRDQLRRSPKRLSSASRSASGVKSIFSQASPSTPPARSRITSEASPEPKMDPLLPAYARQSPPASCLQHSMVLRRGMRAVPNHHASTARIEKQPSVPGTAGTLTYYSRQNPRPRVPGSFAGLENYPYSYAVSGLRPPICNGRSRRVKTTFRIASTDS